MVKNGKIVNNKIRIQDENNMEKEYDVIALIKTKNGDFLAYTDETVKNGGIALYINSIIKDKDQVILDYVTDEEKALVLEKLKERMKNYD